MRIWHGLGAMLAIGVAIIVGCSSGGNGTCVNSGGAPNAGNGQADMCAIAGGSCSATGGGCGPNMHVAVSGSPEANSCNTNYYGGYQNNCGPDYATGAAGLEPASGTCCLPNEDAGTDGSADASADASDDASADAADDGGDSGL